MGRWYEWKMLVERSVAFSPDVLHVLVGAIGAFLASILLQRPLSNWRPWILIFIAVLLNELADVFVERWPSWGMQAGEAARDILLTMSLPTFLLVGTRFSPQRFVDGFVQADNGPND